MGMAVNTVAAGGLPVVDVTATLPNMGVPVSEALPGQGIAVTKVANLGVPVTFAGASSYTTLDPASVTGVTLSGGGLVVTNTGTTSPDQGAKVAASSGKTSGKYYYEAKLTDIVLMGNGAVGVGTFASTYTAMGNGGTTGVVCYWQGGNIWTLAGNTAKTIGTRVDGDVAGIAVDLDNRKIWFRVAPAGNWNGLVIGSENPATATGGVTIPAGTMVPFLTFGGASGQAGNIVTLNFGGSSFVGATPSGFTSGWPA